MSDLLKSLHITPASARRISQTAGTEQHLLKLAAYQLMVGAHVVEFAAQQLEYLLDGGKSEVEPPLGGKPPNSTRAWLSLSSGGVMVFSQAAGRFHWLACAHRRR